MDPAPRAFAELPADPDLGVPVPFACGTDDGYGGTAPSARDLDPRRVVQCALSRVCGVCGAGLGRPIAFLGTASERDRNAFHVPPAHLGCVEALRRAYAATAGPLLGHDEPVADWVVVTTAGFEYVRPAREDLDRRPTFSPNSILV